MSVIVKSMEMPESCYRCPMANDDFYLCGATEKYLENDSEERRPDWCPLIELPFAEELAEKLYKQIEKAVIEGSEE